MVYPIDHLIGQIEFGAIGSHWNYSHEHHNGNGFGWDMIFVEGDTLVNGTNQKILRRTYSRTEFFPQNSTVQGSQIIGTMLITDDSVFVNDRLILDFSMEEGDTLDLNFDYDGNVKLVTDSITIESIDGVDHKKWHLQKLCLLDSNIINTEYVEILEGVGQIGNEYLLWNMDGCLLIGGGTNSFSCYSNGSFNYPESNICDELVDIKDVDLSQLKVYPNPTNDLLFIESEEREIEKIRIYDSTGDVVFTDAAITPSDMEIDVASFSNGIYFIEISHRNKASYFKSFVKF